MFTKEWFPSVCLPHAALAFRYWAAGDGAQGDRCERHGRNLLPITGLVGHRTPDAKPEPGHLGQDS
jgi:hypothetical protein